MYRTSIFDEVGYFDESIRAEDYYMNLKISSKYTIGFLNEYLGYYRWPSATYKIERFNSIADSHLMAIDQFKEQRLYRKAKRMVYLHKFDHFSGFKEYKKRAFVNLIKSMSLFYKKRFLIACVKLLFYGKLAKCSRDQTIIKSGNN